MAKPVKKDNHPIVVGTEPKKELEICIEQFEFLPLQERGSGFLSSHLSQLVELSEQINKKKRDWEDQIIVFLQKNMVEKFPELFICQLSRFYPFSPELLQKNIQRLNDWHMEVNFHVWTNETTKKTMNQLKPNLSWVIEEALCYVEDPTIFVKYAAGISKDQKSHRNDEYLSKRAIWSHLATNAIIWNYGEMINNLKEKYENGNFNWLYNKKINLGKEFIIKYFKLNEYGFWLLATNNYSIEWTNEMKEYINSKVCGTDYEKKVEEAIKNNTTEKANWKRISNNRYREWTEIFIKENRHQLQWKLLSGNPGLPFSIELLDTYAEYWYLEELKSNKGLYDKALAPLLTDRIVDQLLKLCS